MAKSRPAATRMPSRVVVPAQGHPHAPARLTALAQHQRLPAMTTGATERHMSWQTGKNARQLVPRAVHLHAA